MANQVTPIEGSDKVSRERFNQIVSETNAAFAKSIFTEEPSENVDPVGPILPDVTTADNGKILRVVNGVWSAVTISSAGGVSF